MCIYNGEEKEKGKGKTDERYNDLPPFNFLNLKARSRAAMYLFSRRRAYRQFTWEIFLGLCLSDE